MWRLLCLYQHLTAQPLLTLVQPSFSSGHRRHQASERWWWNIGFRGWKKELLFVAVNTISIVFAMIGVNKGQWCQTNKDYGATIHTHTHSRKKWQRGLNSTGKVTTQAILHPQLAETGTTECQCRRGLGSSVQRVGWSIMKERGNLNNFTTTTTTTTPLEILLLHIVKSFGA